MRHLQPLPRKTGILKLRLARFSCHLILNDQCSYVLEKTKIQLTVSTIQIATYEFNYWKLVQNFAQNFLEMPIFHPARIVRTNRQNLKLHRSRTSWFCWFTPGSTHVKFDIWPWSKKKHFLVVSVKTNSGRILSFVRNNVNYRMQNTNLEKRKRLHFMEKTHISNDASFRT